jgi:hypothetical protein
MQIYSKRKHRFKGNSYLGQAGKRGEPADLAVQILVSSTSSRPLEWMSSAKSREELSATPTTRMVASYQSMVWYTAEPVSDNGQFEREIEGDPTCLAWSGRQETMWQRRCCPTPPQPRSTDFTGVGICASRKVGDRNRCSRGRRASTGHWYYQKPRAAGAGEGATSNRTHRIRCH